MKISLLSFIIFLAIIKSFLWMLTIPIFQSPDEISHFAYIQKLGETKKFINPRIDDINSEELIKAAEILNFNWGASHPVWTGYPDNWQKKIENIPSKSRIIFIKHEKRAAKNPSLYYWLGSAFYQLFYGYNFIFRFFSARFYSLLLSLITVFICYKTSNIFFKNKLWALAITSLVIFQPMFSFIGVSVNNDVLAILTASLFIYYGMEVIQTENKKSILKAFLLAIIGVAVKPQLIMFIFVFPSILKNNFLKGILMSLMVVLSLISLAYFFSTFNNGINNLLDRIRYQVAFGGYLEQSSFFFRNFSSSLIVKVPHYFEQTKDTYFSNLFPWFWGVFGWLEVTMPLMVYRILKIFCFVSFIGLIVWSIKKNKKHNQLAGVIFLTLCILFFSFGIIINDFKVFATTGEPFGIQGRYFLPVITPIMILMVLGVKTLIPKNFEKSLAILLIIGSIFLNLVGFWTMYCYFWL